MCWQFCTDRKSSNQVGKGAALSSKIEISQSVDQKGTKEKIEIGVPFPDPVTKDGISIHFYQGHKRIKNVVLVNGVWNLTSRIDDW